MGLMSKKVFIKVLKFISLGLWFLVLVGRISSYVVNLKFLSFGLRFFVLRVVVLGEGEGGYIVNIFKNFFYCWIFIDIFIYG